MLEALDGTGLSGRVHVLGLPDRFLPFGAADLVLASVGLDPDGITDRVRLLLNG